MIKKQVGFQIASFMYPQDYWPQGASSAKYGPMRSAIENLQRDNWEVMDIEFGNVIQGEGTNTQYNILVTLVKYEYEAETAPEPQAVAVKTTSTRGRKPTTKEEK